MVDVRKIGLKLVAAFEIIYGFFSLLLVIGAAAGLLHQNFVYVLWFGIFPMVSLVAGILLWRRHRYSLTLSVLVLLLQVPAIYTGGFLLNLGAPMNLTISGTWLSPDGQEPIILGVNFLALGILIFLLWCCPVMQEVHIADASSSNNLHSSVDTTDLNQINKDATDIYKDTSATKQDCDV